MTPKQFRIQTLNAIDAAGLSRFPDDRYEVGAGVQNPHALLLRSAKLHDTPIPESVLAVARAGLVAARHGLGRRWSFLSARGSGLGGLSGLSGRGGLVPGRGEGRLLTEVEGVAPVVSGLGPLLTGPVVGCLIDRLDRIGSIGIVGAGSGVGAGRSDISVLRGRCLRRRGGGLGDPVGLADEAREGGRGSGLIGRVRRRLL